MCNLVNFNFLLFIIFYNNHVSGIENCYHKVFVHNTAEDDMLFENGLLLEVGVSNRAECISLSHLQDECNLILYNPSSSRCRLHNFNHATGTGIMTPGWSNYARQCTGQPSESNCNVTDLAKLDLCQSCLHENSWKPDDIDMCVAIKKIAHSTGGSTTSLDIDSEFGPGAIAVVKGSVYDTNKNFGVTLKNSAEENSFVYINLRLTPIYCCSMHGTEYEFCDDVMPLIDPSAVTITFGLTNSGTQIYIDGKFIIKFNLQMVNYGTYFGFGHQTQVVIVKAAESCTQP